MPCPWPCGPRRSCPRCSPWSCPGRCRRTSSSSTSPGPEAPLLVTGNSEFTLTVLTGLLALTVSPFYLLLVDTRGDTADMAMIYRSFTPQRLDQALETHRLAERAQPPPAHHPRGAGAPQGGTGRLHRLDHHPGPHLRRGIAPVPGGGVAAAAG